MEHRPFAEKIKRLAPEQWERFVRAVERERWEGELRRELETFGRPVNFYAIERVEERIAA